MSKRSNILTPDFCVIGAGSGGLSFAAGAVQMGASVVLVERGKMGGDCLNSGCVPSKALLAAAKIGHEIQKGAPFGWRVKESQLDYKKVHAHVQSVIKAIAPNDSVDRFEKLGVRVIQAEGSFINDHTLQTKSTQIKAKRFIIATGSSPFIPPIQGLADIPFLTNETIFDLKDLPSHLLIIGGGPIGIEMAQAFKRLGSQVTLLEALTALPKDEPDMTDRLKTILKNEGIDLHEQIQIQSLMQKNKKIICTYKGAKGKEEKCEASHLLIATGRRPSIDALNLDAAGVTYSKRGIEVDKYLRTSNKRIYALGDVIGGYQFTHMAGYHAGIAIQNSIFRLHRSVQTQAIPWVTYTDPELAHVGALEADLILKGTPYKKLELSFEENDRAQTEKRTEGSIRVLVSPKGYVLGATILSAHAGELIYPWVILMQNKLKISTLASAICPYPTFNDINKRIAGSFYKDKIFSPFVQRIVKFIMRLTR